MTNTIGAVLQQGHPGQGRRQAADHLGRAQDRRRSSSPRASSTASRSPRPANYEGTWQFLPFMWSNGGDEKDIATPQTAQALQLWVDLVNDGSASKSVRQLGPGRRQRPVRGRQRGDDGQRAVAVPGPRRGRRPELRASCRSRRPRPGDAVVAPLGGETWTVPQTGDKDRQAKAAKIVACLNSDDNQLALAKRAQHRADQDGADGPSSSPSRPRDGGVHRAACRPPAPAPASSARSGRRPPPRSTPRCRPR